MHFVLYTIKGIVALKVRMATKLFKVRLLEANDIVRKKATP